VNYLTRDSWVGGLIQKDSGPGALLTIPSTQDYRPVYFQLP